MARPESTNDVPLDERTDFVGEIHVDKISNNPMLLKQYAAFLEALAKAGGEFKRNDYGLHNVSLYIPKDAKQIAFHLKSMQSRWDNNKELYEQAVIRDSTGKEFREWERDTVVRFAEENDLPNPFDVFASNDDELDEIRRELESHR